MDQSGPHQLESIGVTIKRRRSQTSRRPRPEAQPQSDQSPKPSTPVSDDTSKISSDENACDGKSGGKMFNLNQCVSRSLPVNGIDSGSGITLGNSTNDGTGTGSENKLKKVKLKVGGVTRTIQTKTSSNGASGCGSSVRTNYYSDDTHSQQRLTSQESSDENHSPPTNKKGGLQGIPWKDFSKGRFSIGRDDMGRASTRNVADKQGDRSDSVRKSKRAPKRRIMDDGFDDDEEDDEIRYLEKLKTSKIAGHKEFEAHSTRKLHKGIKHDSLEDGGRLGKDDRKSRSGNMDYEDEEPLFDGEPEGKNQKKQKKDLSELPTENKREMVLTTRQRALLNKDSPSAAGANQIEFPNGLPPAPSRKQKEKLSEVDQQLKKAEAAQRRRLQNEKAAREIEAEAIRKILGQDSSRKKREEKIKKRQEELAQEKAANAQMLASSTIRTVMGPNGTTVTFSQEMGLPKFFNSNPPSYPLPREKCAGPLCSNAYKYRDSKTKLPLCSLQCYKAIHEKMAKEDTC